MGFDVIAMSRVNSLGTHTADDYCDEPGHYEIGNETGCPWHPDLKPGCYVETKATESFVAHIGSGAFFGAWLDHLAYAAHGVTSSQIRQHPERYRTKAFYELIHNLGEEIIFGPRVCAKLAQDFRGFHEDACLLAHQQLGKQGEKWGDDPHKWPALIQTIKGPAFLATYDQFLDAFALGSQAGLVKLSF